MGIENSSPKSGQMEIVIGIYTEKGRWELKTPLPKSGQMEIVIGIYRKRSDPN